MKSSKTETDEGVFHGNDEGDTETDEGDTGMTKETQK